MSSPYSRKHRQIWKFDASVPGPTGLRCIAGEFTIFAKTGPAIVRGSVEVIDHKDFVGKYPLNPARMLSPSEQMLVPNLPDWYIIPKEVEDICKHAQATTGRPMQMRNFLLRGPAGTG